MKAAALLLIVVGIGIVIWGAFGFQTRAKVLDVGPVHATKDKTHYVPYGPIAGKVQKKVGDIEKVFEKWAGLSFFDRISRC
jgi:hypothetical protein